MPIGLPETSGELRWLLARRMGVAAIAIGLVAGGTSYLVDSYRAVQTALENALDGARHFESPAMQFAISVGTSVDHSELNRLLDRNRFIGIRIFTKDRRQIYESWGDVPGSLIDAAKSGQHEWPERERSHTSWIETSDEKLIQVVLPLSGTDGEIAGYLEGINRLDRKTLETQRVQIRSGAISAAVSVMITAILLYPLLLSMLQRAVGLSCRLLDSNLSLMRSLGNAIAKRDSDTDAHNYRVTIYAVALAEAMALPKREIADLVVGAFLHDVGKIGIPDSILLKPGKLSEDEFRIMKTHALLGIEIVADNRWLVGASSTIRHHHERFDGKGYPDGLAGESIPRIARIFAVVDVFDALTSERPYKRPIGITETLAIIESDSGRHFDPTVVASFKRIASSLYDRTASASAEHLKREMGTLLQRYFHTQTALG